MILILINQFYPKLYRYTALKWVEKCNYFHNHLNRLIDFNDISTCLVLFYAWRLGNCIHCTFISTFFVLLFDFFLYFLLTALLNTDSLQTDQFDPQMRLQQALSLWVKVDLGVIAMRRYSTFPRSSRTGALP